MNGEIEKKYIDPVNRNIDIVLCILAIVLMCVIGYLLFLYFDNENGKVSFDLNDIKNSSWINNVNDVVFKITDETISLTIDDTEIIEDAPYTFNNVTGEIIYTINDVSIDGNLYLRSVSNSNITIWYNYADIHLEKVIEAN